MNELIAARVPEAVRVTGHHLNDSSREYVQDEHEQETNIQAPEGYAAQTIAPGVLRYQIARTEEHCCY